VTKPSSQLPQKREFVLSHPCRDETAARMGHPHADVSGYLRGVGHPPVNGRERKTRASRKGRRPRRRTMKPVLHGFKAYRALLPSARFEGRSLFWPQTAYRPC